MGVTPSAIKDQAKADENEANDALNSLQEMAAKNLELFLTKVKSLENDKLEIPIRKIIANTQTIQCNVAQSADGLKNTISSVIGDIATGDFLAAITKTIGFGIDALLGNYQGNISKKEDYIISVSPLSGFYRIDYFFWSYQYTSQSLIKVVKNVVCVAVIISSVKTSELDDNTLRVIIGSKFGGLPIEEQKKIYNEAVNAIGNHNQTNNVLNSLKSGIGVRNIAEWNFPGEFLKKHVAIEDNKKSVEECVKYAFEHDPRRTQDTVISKPVRADLIKFNILKDHVQDKGQDPSDPSLGLCWIYNVTLWNYKGFGGHSWGPITSYILICNYNLFTRTIFHVKGYIAPDGTVVLFSDDWRKSLFLKNDDLDEKKDD